MKALRDHAVLLRLSKVEDDRLLELAERYGLTRQNVLRLLVKQAHDLGATSAPKPAKSRAVKGRSRA